MLAVIAASTRMHSSPSRKTSTAMSSALTVDGLSSEVGSGAPPEAIALQISTASDDRGARSRPRSDHRCARRGRLLWSDGWPMVIGGSTERIARRIVIPTDIIGFHFPAPLSVKFWVSGGDPGPSSTATAAAEPAVWVSERWTRVTPSSRARRAAPPCSRSAGEPSSARVTSSSRQPIARAACVPRNALYAASFAATRAARMQRRPRTAQRVRALRVREQLLQCVIALGGDHSLDARDLDHVDADRDDHDVRLSDFLSACFFRPNSRFQNDGWPRRSSLNTG